MHQARSTTEEFVKQLSQLTIPLLIMSCEHDPLNQRTGTSTFKRSSPAPRFIASCIPSHEPQIEETEEFNRVLTEFLQS